jgi:5-azacytidine-induced protein 1
MPLVPSAEEIESLEKASQAAAEVTNTMLSNRLELEEKKRTISMLQKALVYNRTKLGDGLMYELNVLMHFQNQQRELTVRHTKETEKELEARFTMQKQEYEATIQRHLNFIDQVSGTSLGFYLTGEFGEHLTLVKLIDDKKNLSEKCEKLIKELKDVEKKYGDRIRTLEDKYVNNFKRDRDSLLLSMWPFI